MNETNKKRLITIINNNLRTYKEDMLISSDSIARKESPFSGNGWLDKLSKLVLNKTREYLKDFLISIKDDIIKSFSTDDYDEIKKMIQIEYSIAIDTVMLYSPYKTLLSGDLSKRHLIRILDYLKEDINVSLESSFNKWSFESDRNKTSISKEFRQSLQSNTIALIVKKLFSVFGKIIAFIKLFF